MTMCTDCALNLTGLWRDLVNVQELKVLNAEWQLCLKLFMRMESGQSVD
jgi:hypothetical protein